MKTQTTSAASRRTFLKTSGGAATGAALYSAIAARAHAGEANTVRIALIGCGGRGSGAAADALGTKGPTTLWAMADVFPHRMKNSLDALNKRFGGKVDVPEGRQFIGLDAYKKVIDMLGKTDVVLLTTPAGFRPIHLEYAVQKGVNVFMEKSFAVDAPGVRRVLKAGEEAAKKNLKIAGGLMWRHCVAREECIKRIHDGEIGDLMLLRAYRMHGPCGFRPKNPGESDLAHQISNYNGFIWLNASFFVDWHCHNVDVCCWAKNAWPVSAQGMGGRQQRTAGDQMWDHYAVEYTFADGTKLLAQTRQQDKCYGVYTDIAHGTKGSAVIMDSLSAPKSRLYKNHVQTAENETWRHPGPVPNPYQVEHDLLFDAIRNDKPYNETERCAKACLAALMGRMAAHTGQVVTWEDAMKSEFQIAPGLDDLKWDGPPPVLPDKDGKYPFPIPGVTKEV